MSDIVERLRDHDRWWQAKCDEWLASAREMSPETDLTDTEASMRKTKEAEAADEIERLRSLATQHHQGGEVKKAAKRALAALEYADNYVDVGHYERHAAIRELRAALAQQPLSVQEGWRPIETAPIDGTDILVCVTYNLSADEWETKIWVDWQVPAERWPCYWGRIDIPFSPTHWQPLPAAPTVGGTE